MLRRKLRENDENMLWLLGKIKKTRDDPPPHHYIGAIAECWDVYGDILNKEFSDPASFKVHRTTVDAYAAQQIGNQDDRRARQSANVHLIGLYLTFSQKVSHEDVLTFIRNATKIKRDWPPLIQRKTPEWLTLQDIIKADNPSSHAHLVTRWGQSVWEAYADYHEDIIKTYERSMGEL
jgi:hypothetical protein